MVLEFLIVFVCSVLSLFYGGYTIKKILEEPQGSDRMVEIASAIQEGAQAYLNRQYFTISIVGIVIAILLFYLMDNHFIYFIYFFFLYIKTFYVFNNINTNCFLIIEKFFSYFFGIFKI